MALILIMNCTGHISSIFPADIIVVMMARSVLVASSCLLAGGVVNLNDASPSRIEMFHHRITVICQNNFVLTLP